MGSSALIISFLRCLWLVSCKKHSLKYTTVDMDFSDDTAAKMWIIQNQLGRRNLTPFIKAELALKVEPEIRAEAQKNSLANLVNIDEQKSDHRGRTLDQLAAIAGVSHDTIHKVKVIKERAPESIKQACREGNRGLYCAVPELNSDTLFYGDHTR